MCSTATLETGIGARISPAWGFALTGKRCRDLEPDASYLHAFGSVVAHARYLVVRVAGGPPQRLYASRR
jgi:hypothetical protein